MTTEQIKAAAKEATDNWQGTDKMLDPFREDEDAYEAYEQGVEAGIKIGLEAKIEMPEDIRESAEVLELRGFKELALSQIREMNKENKSLTEQLKAIQSKCVAYEGELEKKDEERKNESIAAMKYTISKVNETFDQCGLPAMKVDTAGLADADHERAYQTFLSQTKVNETGIQS